MIQRQPFNQLFLIMACAALLVSAISIVSLYNTAIEQHRLRLVETVKGQARLIEAIAQFDSLETEDNNPALAGQSTLEKVAAAIRNSKASAVAVNLPSRGEIMTKSSSCSAIGIHRDRNYDRFHSMAYGRSRCVEPCPVIQG